MKLSADQLKQFNDQGFVVLPHFFTEREVAAMRAELDRFKREGMLRNVATDGDGKTHSNTVQNLQICPISPKSEFYRALPFCPKVVAVVRQLIGDPVQHHLDQIFLKPGRHGMGTNWHQDNAYFGLTDPTKGVGMWVALHDATIANGTMTVIPGIYREKLTHQRDGNSDHHIRCYPNEDKAVPIEIKAGGALFFNYGVPHCTRGNTTEHERAGLALHFLRTDFRNPKHTYTLPVLSGPEATGGVKEWGVKVEGTWEQQVERMLAAPINA
jgi:ectoine hydroxylase-related dioxygenase (phytanoyl-CoA dioxygenase family)